MGLIFIQRSKFREVICKIFIIGLWLPTQYAITIIVVITGLFYKGRQGKQAYLSPDGK